MEHLSFGEFNRVDLVDFLATIGIRPKKQKTHQFYYLSPLAGHPDDRPTFIVDRRLNRWRETTNKQSGGLADLAVRLYDCTIGELTTILRAAVSQPGASKQPDSTPAITIERTHPIRSNYLEHYIWERRIPVYVARIFCLEAWYNRGSNTYAALAFRNDLGGYELFNRNHFYRIPPYSPTFIRNHSQSLLVFRQVLDLLTYVAINPEPISKLPDLLILNAPMPFSAVKEIIFPYRQSHLFLPNDAAGIAFGAHGLKALPNCHDHRSMYQGYASLNHWICGIGTAPGPRIPPSLADLQEPHPPPTHPGKA